MLNLLVLNAFYNVREKMINVAHVIFQWFTTDF